MQKGEIESKRFKGGEIGVDKIREGVREREREMRESEREKREKRVRDRERDREIFDFHFTLY